MKHHPLRTWLLAFTVMLSLLIGSAMALETPAPGKRLSTGQPSIQNLALYAAASSGDALHKALENVLPEVNNSLKDTNQKQIAYLELNGNTVTVNIIDENYPAMSMLQTQQFFNIIFNNADVKSMVQSLKFPALKNLKYGSDQSDAVIKPPVDAEVYKLKGKNIDNMLDSDQFNIMFRVAWITLYPNANNADEDNSYTVEKDLLKNKDMLIGRLLSAKVTKVTVLLSPPDGAFEDQEYVFHFKKADTYTASFVDADGKNLGTQTLMPGAKITFPAAPKGYTIEKWTDESGTAVDPENTTMGTENCTFTAHVTPITSHLTLECMGGTLPDGTQTPFPVTYDQPYNLPTPTRSGFYFGGWYQEHDAETDLYTAGLSGNCDITADSTVYAQWVLLVTCDFTTEDGGFSSGNIDNPVKVQKNLPYSIYQTFKETPVRFQYVFGGWYVDENYETPIGTKCTLTGNENGEVTIYAKWVKKVTYTVTYDCCDEAFEDPQPEKSFTITVGEKYGTLPTPTRTGYNFKGWYADKDYKTAIATGETCLLSSSDGSTNVSIYAKWEPTSYPITYTLNGGTLSGEYKKTYTTEESFNLPIPTKLGYTFLGWTGDYISEGPKVDVNIPEGMFGECKYTANWERETYTITYKNVEVKLEGAPEEFTIESETFTLPEPTKTGYTFLGWKKDESSQAIKPVTIAKGSTGSRTYTAEWKAIEYPITYTLNGGILSGDYKKTYTIEETFHLPVPTKPGYTFEGWTGTDLYAPATEVNIPVKTSGPLSYTATWKVITYTVTCEPNEGTLTSEKIFTVDYDAKYSDAGLTDPTRPGYKFLGWCSDEGCTTLIGETCKLLPANESTNVTIYAKWEPLEATTYTIEYNLDGGTALTSPKTTYTVAETPFALPTTTKSGYTFVGWTVKIKESSKQIGASLTKIPEGTTGNLVCTANWSAPSSTRYDIQYELDGGAVTAGSTASFTIATGEQYPELPTLYRKGYQFKGWLLVQNEPDSKIEAGDICTVTANTTLYPYWVLESYKIEYPGLTKDEIAALGNPESYTMKDGNITLKNPSRKGYTFDGWTSAISSKLETTIIIETSKTTSDLQYTAHFTPITYNISYTGVEDSDWPSGGEITSYDITMTTSTPPLKLPNPFRSGLVFRGWTSTDLNISTPQRDYTIPAETIGNLTFTANWEAEQSITVVSSNSSDGNLTSVTVDFIYLGNQAQALCAFYDASGNLCEIQCKALSNTTSAASDTTTTQTWTFTANKTATSAKLFLLKDKSLQPVCPPKETQVQP